MREQLLANMDGEIPLYLQLAANMKQYILRGGVKPGKALPSERDLSEMTGMSRVTVRKALDKLIEDGLLFRKQGAGTFVASRIQAPSSVLTGFSEDARRRGEKAGVIWMFKTYGLPIEEEASMLEIPSTAEVARLGRVRLLDDEPLAIEHAVVPRKFLPDLKVVGESLYAALDAAGNRPVTGWQRVRASLANPTEAGIFSIRENAEILRIERLTRLANGSPVEFTRSAYRGERFDFVSDLRSET